MDKDKQITQLTEQLKKKKTEIRQLQNALEEKTATVIQVGQQLERKTGQVEELVEKLQIKEQECAIYKTDFEGERNDRQRIHQQLTEQLETTQTRLVETQEKLAIAKENSVKAHQQSFTSVQLLERLRKFETDIAQKDETIDILTAQVNAHYERGEEVKRELIMSENKRKQLENENSKLKATIDPLLVERARNQSEEIHSLQIKLKRWEMYSGQDTTKLQKELSTTKQQLENVIRRKQSLTQQVNELQQELIELHTVNERLKEANKVLTIKIKSLPLSPPIYPAIYETCEPYPPNSPSLSSNITNEHSTISSHASNGDVPPAFTQEEMERIFKPQPLQVHVIDVCHKETKIAACNTPCHHINGAQNQSVHAIETTQHISKRVQFTCMSNDSSNDNNQYPDGEIPVLSNEEFANLFSTQLDPIQEEERERRRLRKEADQALREVDSARQREGQAYHRLSIDSLKRDIPLSQSQEETDKALKELDEARKESSYIARKSPNRRSVDYKLHSPHYKPFPIKHSKFSDEPFYTHNATNQAPYVSHLSHEDNDRQFNSPHYPLRHSQSSDCGVMGEGPLYTQISTECKPQVSSEEEMKKLCEKEHIQREEKQRERSTSERHVQNTEEKIRKQGRDERDGIERKRSPSFPPHLLSQSIHDHDRDYHEMTKKHSPSKERNMIPQNISHFTGFTHENEDKEESLQIDPYNRQIYEEIQQAAQWVYDQSRRPLTAEVEADSDEESTLPYDPNLICPKCGKRYHIGGIQLFKRHVTELCPLLEKT